METSSKTTARFLLKKEIYDDGESIDILNTSKNAKKIFWEFGDDQISTEQSPIFSASLNNLTSKRVSITLHAYGESGYIDTIEKSIVISKRLLADISITKISEQVRSKMEEFDGKGTFLLISFGPVSEVDGWSPKSHQLPKSFFSNLTKLPFKFNLENSNSFFMNNEEWYLRISSQVSDSAAPIYLNEFRFFPPKQLPIKINENLNKFILRDENMEIEVEFRYARY